MCRSTVYRVRVIIKAASIEPAVISAQERGIVLHEPEFDTKRGWVFAEADATAKQLADWMLAHPDAPFPDGALLWHGELIPPESPPPTI